jgi:hypothetical protein
VERSAGPVAIGQDGRLVGPTSVDLVHAGRWTRCNRVPTLAQATLRPVLASPIPFGAPRLHRSLARQCHRKCGRDMDKEALEATQEVARVTTIRWPDWCLVDLGDLGVAHHPLDRVLAGVPISAENRTAWVVVTSIATSEAKRFAAPKNVSPGSPRSERPAAAYVIWRAASIFIPMSANRIAARRGPKKANVAIQRSMLIAFCHMACGDRRDRDRADHRHRSTTTPGPTTSVDRLNSVMARAGESPEVVLEATYGWYWAVDALQAAGRARHAETLCRASITNLGAGKPKAWRARA